MYGKKIKLENIGIKHYSYLKINISFISLYILSMSRKKKTVLIVSNIPVHKGANQVPLSPLSNHGELFQDSFFSLFSRKAVPPSILEIIHYPKRDLYLLHLVSAGTEVLKVRRKAEGFRLFLWCFSKAALTWLGSKLDLQSTAVHKLLPPFSFLFFFPP